MIQLPLRESDPSLEERMRLSKETAQLLLTISQRRGKRTYHEFGERPYDTAMVVACVKGRTVGIVSIPPGSAFAEVETYGSFRVCEPQLEKVYFKANKETSAANNHERAA